MNDEWTDADAAIEEVWEIRRRIWARFDDDPEKLMAHYIKRDKQRGRSRIEAPQPDKNGKSTI